MLIRAVHMMSCTRVWSDYTTAILENLALEINTRNTVPTASTFIFNTSFQGVKRPGRGTDHPPPSSAEFEERVDL